jgi:hypothetical protein
LIDREHMIARLEQALEHGGGTYALHDIVEGLGEGRFQLFWNEEGMAVTEIIQAPQKRYLNIFLAAGEMKAVLKLHRKIEKFARENGCDFMQATARKGWEKIGPSVGWQSTHTVYTRQLT